VAFPIGVSKKAIEEFRDPRWRLRNLYFIKDENGNKVKFSPNWAQEDFIDEMWFLNLVLKSRQLGFTTVIDLFMLDATLFNPNVNARVIADSDAKAKEIFEDKIRFAYNNLPDWLRELGQETEIESMHALKFANGSSIRVGTSARGLTEQYLHVSELGKISLDFPKKALEIKTGAFNTVHPGNFIFVESTAKGRGGVFFELCDMAAKAAQAKRELTTMSWKLHFYPWFVDPRCALTPVDAKKVVITDEHKEYFAKVEAKMDVELSAEQRAWYVMKAQTMSDKMKEEFPSTPEEPFEVPLEGAYYGREMVRVRGEGRFCRLPWLPGERVNAFLDIGHSDYTSIWLHQHVYPWNHFLAYYQNSGEKVAHYANWIRNAAMEKGCVLGTIYLPHDAASEHADTENTYEAQIRKLLPGVNVHVVDRPNDKFYDGIEAVRRELPSCKFDIEGCDEGVRVLENYRKQWNELLGVWRNEPLHDWASHGADGFEQFARGFVGGAQKGFKRSRAQRGSHRTV
jgi:hypothetical protein